MCKHKAKHIRRSILFAPYDHPRSPLVSWVMETCNKCKCARIVERQYKRAPKGGIYPTGNLSALPWATPIKDDG